jgi:hypothetical protein
MKKLILLSAVAAAVILFSMNLNLSGQGNKATDNGRTNIHYQITIHPGWKLTHNSCPKLIELTDGSGLLIGQSQLYQTGINTYYFYEVGPVSGTRSAKLINVAYVLPDDVCSIISLWNSRSGTFYSGETYMFNLYESAKDRIEPGPPVATE